MSCFLKELPRERKFFALLTFKAGNIFYDAANNCYVEGHIIEGDHDEMRHTVQDIAEEGNRDRGLRVLDLEHTRVTEMLLPYTRHKVHIPELDNELREPDSYNILLLLPDTFSQTTLNLLERLIHEYLSARVVADWLSIAYPAKSQIWAEKASDAAEAIKTALSRGIGPIRRPMWPSF